MIRWLLATVLLLSLADASITNSPVMRDALAAFVEMRPSFLAAGMTEEDYDERRDAFVDSYVYLLESGKVGGKTFEMKINPNSLLRQIDIIRIFGVTPQGVDLSGGGATKEEAPDGVEDAEEALIEEFGLDLVMEAKIILLAHHGDDHDLPHFTRLYAPIMDRIEGEDEMERVQVALNDTEVQGLLGRSRSKRFYMDETLKVKTGDEVSPLPERAFPHIRSFSFEQTGTLGSFLETEHYSASLIEECTELKRIGSNSVDQTCLEPARCMNVDLKRRCMEDADGIPDEFRDWEELDYITSLLPYRAGTTLPAGWAHTATQIVDLYQQIYAKNVTWYRRDLTDLFQIMNCVYRTTGLSRGSPQAAFQYMSDKYIVPKFGESMPLNCRDGDPEKCGDNEYAEFINEKLLKSSGDVFYKFIYLWDKTRKGQNNAFCSNTSIYEPSNSATPDVKFLPGKAYIQFADESSAVVRAGPSGTQLTTVYGEEVVKPLLYKKGPVAVIMSMCYEIFFVAEGIFNLDCKKYSTRQYLPQWVMLATYGPDYFGTVLPKIHAAKTLDVWYPDITKISRANQFQFYWNTFVVPRVDPYANTLNCENGGRYIESLIETSCFCPVGYYGDLCEKACLLKCKNGGQLSHRTCKCVCPVSHYGITCKKKCECNYGRCDHNGQCICNRQKSWGQKCENICNCKHGGYCHLDGTCECVAGKAGPTCEEPCTKSCKYPKVCRFSNQPTETQQMFHEMCACPQGFFGADCSSRVDCVSADIQDFIECHRYKTRKRCYTDDAMYGCPHHCGHCYDLHVIYDVDS